MTFDETTRQGGIVEIRAALSAAFDCVFRRFGRFAKLAALPFVLTVVLGALEIPAVLTVPDSEIIFTVLEFVPFAILGVTLNRTILIRGEPGMGARSVLGRRTWKYLGYMLLISLLLAIPLVILIVAVLGVSYVTSGGAQQGLHFSGGPWAIAGGVLGLLLLLLYVSGRLGLVFPAIAVDHKLGLRGAWRLTGGGNSLKLLAVLLVVVLVVALLAALGATLTGQQIHIGTGLPDGFVLPEGATATDLVLAVLPSFIVSSLVSYLGFGLLTGAYAYVFVQLSGWGGPREEILERFE